MKPDITKAAKLFGSMGGKAAAAKMTLEQRKARAKKGAAARHAKRKSKLKDSQQ